MTTTTRMAVLASESRENVLTILRSSQALHSVPRPNLGLT